MKGKPKATVFRFRSYQFDETRRIATFHYELCFSNKKPILFAETIRLPKQPQKNVPEHTVQKLLTCLHLALGISYYKLYCPPKIEIPFSLTKEEAAFWHTVYKKGLGEFLYKNNLHPKIIPQFSYSKKIKPSPARINVKDRVLLGVSGGKDSIVAAELLRNNFSTTSFLVETQKTDTITRTIIKTIGYPSLIIKRTLDPKLFEPHEGAYNGHIPVSAIYAFMGLFCAVLYGYKYVTVGNAQSSNSGNLTHHGEIINHQWSKSSEFESLLQSYTRTHITPDITYCSLLRQFYEIRIAKILTTYKQYLPLFSSCNKNFRVAKKRPGMRWCGECPKCAFVFLLFAAFFPKKEIISIFGKNMLAQKELLPLYRDILGFGKQKPFDCVGTFEESRAALVLASEKFVQDVAIKTFLPKINRPKEYIEQVLRTVPAPTLPTPFRFLGIKNVCLLGYGKEGVAAERHIKQFYPHLAVGILDQKKDPQYLKHQIEYDFAIKTPGIPKRMVTIPYTTTTNIFFARNKNFTIGVTGTKGKSTTASLIRDMLTAGGKKVRVLGNIGSPTLEVFSKKINPKEIFVLELSSYMLEDIEYSPNIAVLLNLFPDHLDYHGGVDAYYTAKKNIFAFQKPGDVALVPPFRETLPLDKKNIPLHGNHNIKNIRAATTVARILSIPDTAITRAIKNFQPLPHRLEFVGTFQGILFYDDAISTTPESTIAALEALSRVKTIFLGGTDRGYNFIKLEQVLHKHHIENIVLFPESGRRIIKNRKGFRILETVSMEEAVRFAYKHTPNGSICLLSTASPSYSLWNNFEEKGTLFQTFVKQYIKGSHNS